MQNQTVTIDDILEKLLKINQEVFSELATLNLTLEVVEVVMVPIERRMVARIKEYKGNALKSHQKDSPLIMHDASFEEYINKHLPMSARMRLADTTHLMPEDVENILESAEIQEYENKENENGHTTGLQFDEHNAQDADDRVRDDGVQDL